MPAPWRLQVGLALGGGAARGLAHIGVIRALVREGIPIDVVTGTSMGAIIGGAWIAVGDISDVERRVRDLIRSDLFRKLRRGFLRETKKQRGGLLYSVANLVKRGIVFGSSTLRTSFLSAEEFARNMAAMLPDRQIQGLPIPYGAVAVDLEKGQEVVIRSGSLRDAAMASSAIPGVLPPVRRNGRLLIDGGWVDKVPVLPAFRLGADVVVAVDISADLEDAADLSRGIDIMIRANAVKDHVFVRYLRRMADVVVEPAVRKIHWADFSQLDTCVRAGDEAATEAAPKIRELLRHERWRSVVRSPGGKRNAAMHFADAERWLTLE